MRLNQTGENYPLTIGVKRGRWRREPGIESADREFALVKPKVLDRDRHQCVRCGTSVSGLHVHHRNDDHSDNRMSNLETRCDLCHAASHVGLLGRSGSIAYLPLVTQEDLSHLARTAAVAIQFGGEHATEARALYAALTDLHSAPIDQAFGTHDPADFGNALLAIEDDDYARRSEPLQGVRVIFNPDTITSFGVRARKSGFENNGPDLWDKITQSVLAAGEPLDGNQGAVQTHHA